MRLALALPLLPACDMLFGLGDLVGATVVYFEVSPDGAGWHLLRAGVVSFPVNAVGIQFLAGSFQGGMPMPGEARFDNFALCAPAD